MKLFIVSKKKVFFISSIFLFLVIRWFPFSNTIISTSYSQIYDSDDYQYVIPNLTKNKEKIAYLTFDDGPSSSVTPKILDILKNEKIEATFFVIGKKVEMYPAIVKRAYDEGHYIANHTYSHNNSMIYQSANSFIEEIKKTDMAIQKAIDEDAYCSHLFRFPNGFMSALYKSQKKSLLPILEKMEYTYIDWNCLTNDSMQKYSNTQLLQNLKNSCKNKGTLVVLMHDTNDVNDSSLVLKDCISYLKEQGYCFKNFYEFFED